MTWTRISDDFGEDCWTLSDQAFRLHVEGLGWSNAKLLDLRIPKDDLRRFAKHPEAAVELVGCGWWSDEADAYVIRHQGMYQRTREQVLAQQEANRKNGRRGGRPPRKARPLETESVSESPSEPRTRRDGTGLEGLAPTESDQTEKPRVGKCRSCGHREPLDASGECVDQVTCRRVRGAA